MPSRHLASLVVVFMACVVACGLAQPLGWKLLQSDAESDVIVPSSHQLRVVLAVRQRNVRKLSAIFDAVSDPDNAKYGQFLSLAEVAALTAPSQEHISTAVHFLRGLGCRHVSTTLHGDFVSGTVTVGDVRSAFPGVRFGHYEHQLSGTTVVRATRRVALPPAVVDATDVVSGLWDVPLMADHLRSTSVVPLSPAGSVPATDDDSGVADAQVMFVTSGNNRLTALCQLNCAAANCTANAFNQVTMVATPTGATRLARGVVTATYDTVAPFCAAEDGAFACKLTINNATNYQTYDVSIFAVDTQGTNVTASFSVPVAARPWTLPATVHDRYNVPASELSASKKGQDGVVLWAGQYFDPDYLAKYLEATGSPPQKAFIENPWKNATNNPNLSGGEGQMDIELITSTATGVQSTFWYASNNISVGFLDFCLQIADVPDPPLVWSCSWGTPETSMPGPDGPAFEARVSVELQKMGARGMTLMFASGDAGVTSAGRGGSCDTFQPSFPAASPYVLSVSGTVLAPASSSTTNSRHRLASQPPICGTDMNGVGITCNSPDALDNVQEIASSCCSDGTIWTGAGGFSSKYPRPAWQEAAVAQYLATATDLPPSSMWNSSNRAFPDVAALSDQVLINRDVWQSSGGTSAASPITAGLLALVNDARLRSGRPPLGFVAPWLYKVAASTPAAFNDVTVGSNACGELVCCPYGFTASKGYDPVTGWGSMNVDVLIKLATGVPL